jgi:hypothetical protein
MDSVNSIVHLDFSVSQRLNKVKGQNTAAYTTGWGTIVFDNFLIYNNESIVEGICVKIGNGTRLCTSPYVILNPFQVELTTSSSIPIEFTSVVIEFRIQQVQCNVGVQCIQYNTTSINEVCNSKYYSGPLTLLELGCQVNIDLTDTTMDPVLSPTLSLYDFDENTLYTDSEQFSIIQNTLYTCLYTLTIPQLYTDGYIVTSGTSSIPQPITYALDNQSIPLTFNLSVQGNDTTTTTTTSLAAPTNVSVVSTSSTTATVSFTPVSGALSYTATATYSGGSLTASSSSTPIQFTNLIPETTYSITVVANGTDTTSPPSSLAVSITPLAAPTGILAVTTSSTTAGVYFTAVSGASSYTATSSPGGITASSSTTSITVTGLSTDISYTFTVVAESTNATSSSSSASNVVVSYSESFLTNASNWPISISVPSSISIADNATLSGSDYFNILSDNVTIDGFTHTLTIATVTNGVFRNGTSSTSGYDNVTIQNITVDGSLTTMNIDGGWLCQSYFGNGATNNVVINCNSTGDVSQSGSGGICGASTASSSGSIEVINCSSTGNISGTSAGGIFGINAGSSNGIVDAINCYSTGNILSSSGGIFGEAAGSSSGVATATDCYSTGEISGSSGGIFGFIAGYNSGDATATNCYSQGTVSTTSGGIFGASAGSSSGNATATNCYSVYRTIAGINSTVSQSNIYEPAGTWNDTNASSSLTGDPSTFPGTGTTWTSEVADTAWVLTSFL